MLGKWFTPEPDLYHPIPEPDPCTNYPTCRNRARFRRILYSFFSEKTAPFRLITRWVLDSSCNMRVALLRSMSEMVSIWVQVSLVRCDLKRKLESIYARQKAGSMTDSDSGRRPGRKYWKLEDKIVDFTAEMADEFTDIERFDPDRALKDWLVEEYLEKIRNQEFLAEQVSIFTCLVNGKLYRINGQHTGYARALAGDIGRKFEVRMVKFGAESSEGVRDLYLSVDQSKGRSAADVTRTTLHGVFDDIPDILVATMRGALGFWLYENPAERKRKCKPAVAAERLKKVYPELVQEVGAFFKKHEGDVKHIVRVAVMAMVMATFKLDPEDAKAFWGPVADGLGIKLKGDPRLILREKLLRTNVNVTTSGKETASAELMYRWCILCWNAFRQDRLRQKLPTKLSGEPREKLV